MCHRRRTVRARGARRARRACIATMLSLLAVIPAHAQRTQPVGISRTPIVADTIADSLKHPPIAPRRAMIYSMLLPGFAQSRLNRPTSSILFAVAEVLSIGMARKAALDLREARAARQDSIPTGFTADTVTGAITATGFTQNRLGARTGARQKHHKKRTTEVTFHHTTSSAYASLAANLWDFKANVAVTPIPNGAAVGASLAF